MKFLIRIALLLGILLFSLGAYASLRGYFQAKSSAFWEESKGVVITSRIIKMPLPDDFGGIPYEAFIEYEYQVGDTTYRNSTISLSDPLKTFNAKEDAEQFRRLYPLGRKVNVYYDPESPDESCLEKGGGNLCFAIAGFLLSISCVLLCLWGLGRLSSVVSYD